jgi:hypothetical protein
MDKVARHILMKLDELFAFYRNHSIASWIIEGSGSGKEFYAFPG